jgi:hypothetical protein
MWSRLLSDLKITSPEYPGGVGAEPPLSYKLLMLH